MATADRASSGGVKSLRAMFENANAAADNDSNRGRASSATANEGDDTPRQLSKVTTAFVPVEGNTPTSTKNSERRPGAKRENIVRANGDANGEAVNGQHQARGNESSENRSSPPVEVLKNLATSLKTPSKSDLRSTSVALNPADLIGTTDGMSSTMATKQQASSTATGISTVSSAYKYRSSKPAPINVEKTRSNLHPPTNGHKPLNEPQTPTKLRPHTSITKQAKSPQPQSRTTHASSSSDTTKALPSFARGTTSNASKVKPGLNTSTTNKSSKSRPPTDGIRSATGFIKPRPRSPTRPVALPAHLVAPTASSAAKRSETPSFDLPMAGMRSRRPSTYSVASTRPSLSNLYAASQSGTLARKPSATFGPPPRRKQAPASPSAPARPPDSFLQRMMRPTASSASKVRDGVDDTHSPHRPRVASRMGGPRVASTAGNPTKMRSMQNLRDMRTEPAAPPAPAPKVERDAASLGAYDAISAVAGADKSAAAAAQETASETSTADKTASSTATLVPDEERSSVEVEDVVLSKDGATAEEATLPPLSTVE